MARTDLTDELHEFTGFRTVREAPGFVNPVSLIQAYYFSIAFFSLTAYSNCICLIENF